MSDVDLNATDDIRNDIAGALGQEESNSNTADDSVAASLAQATEQVEARARDEQGRFAKKQEEAAQAAAQVAADAEQKAVEQPAVAARKAPQSWKPDIKAHFDTLPPEVQDEILRRETDFNKGIQKYAEDAKYAQTFRAAAEPWAPYLNHLQMTPDQAFQHLIGHEYVLRTGSPAQKQAKLMELAQAYGIDLGQQQADGQQQYQMDPNVQHAVQRVQQLETYIQKLEYDKQQQAARQQQAEMADLGQQIETFASNPNVPHFETVRQDMANMLAAGLADDLQDAYDKACWARPDIRASLIQADAEKRIQEKAELANKAKAKAVSVTGSPSGAAVPIAGASIRDDLTAALNAVGGRL